MHWLIRDAARRTRQDIRIPVLIWREDRNTWLWSLKHATRMWTKYGDCMDCLPKQ